MDENTNTPQTQSTWSTLWSQAKDVLQAGVGAYKDFTGAQLTEAQAKALNRQKAAPNYTVIGLVALGAVILIGGIVWIIKRKKS